MIDEVANQGMVMAGMGVTGYLSTSIMSMFKNMIANGHQFKMKALEVRQENYKNQIKDVQNARKFEFKFARRAIVFGVFYLPYIIMAILVLKKVPIVIPTQVHHSFLFGLVKVSNVVMRPILAYPFIAKSYCDMMSLIGGMYFGTKN